MQRKLLWILLLALYSCQGDDDLTDQPAESPFTLRSVDGRLKAPFGSIDYRVYYPEEWDQLTHVIHVSRGGNGIGDDRGKLANYVTAYVQAGYVVVQIDHRFAGGNIEKIAQFRGEEIQFFGSQVALGLLDYGDFRGTVDGSSQGFAGHSGGCMEGLMAAGTAMTHGNYAVPQIKAVYGMSPAGNHPDQFGIASNPSGYQEIGEAAIFVIIGAEEKDVNGPGRFMAENWRLQPYEAMTNQGPRYQALVQGKNTDHMDIKGENPDIEQYNRDNSLAFFDQFLRGKAISGPLGRISVPPSLDIDLSIK